jgi:hypothetical protein
MADYNELIKIDILKNYVTHVLDNVYVLQPDVSDDDPKVMNFLRREEFKDILVKIEEELDTDEVMDDEV